MLNTEFFVFGVDCALSSVFSLVSSHKFCNRFANCGENSILANFRGGIRVTVEYSTAPRVTGNHMMARTRKFEGRSTSCHVTKLLCQPQ
jgi:hypothetical protein